IGIVWALGNPSNKTRKGPYILLPAYREIIAETAESLKEYKAIKESLRQDACKFIQLLEEGNLGYALYYLNKLEEYYKYQGARVFWTIITTFMKLSEIESYASQNKTNLIDSSRQIEHNSTDNLDNKLQKEAIERGLLISLIPYVIINQLIIPIKIFIKTIIEKECDI
ncbi:MAG: hypothetical protein GXO43_08415, partial [Crenarchaeota archaeon]|nr:hypothetical protein [Thermoproteota archaeon]